MIVTILGSAKNGDFCLADIFFEMCFWISDYYALEFVLYKVILLQPGIEKACSFNLELK
jgi:hypothetical protein